MALAQNREPFPVTYRELWLPSHIRGTTLLPAFRGDAHGLILTGAQKQTTCDGVLFNGTATSNINYGAIHNAARIAIRFRFRP